MHGVLELSLSHQSQIAVIGRVLPVFLGAVGVVRTDVNVDASLLVLSVLERNLEASVSVVLQVNLSFQFQFIQGLGEHYFRFLFNHLHGSCLLNGNLWLVGICTGQWGSLLGTCSTRVELGGEFL